LIVDVAVDFFIFIFSTRRLCVLQRSINFEGHWVSPNVPSVIYVQHSGVLCSFVDSLVGGCYSIIQRSLFTRIYVSCGFRFWSKI
jgi:hypothetical protein